MDVGIGRTHPLLDTLAQVRDTSSSVRPLERLLEGTREAQTSILLFSITASVLRASGSSHKQYAESAKDLALTLMKHRMKLVYFHLSSGDSRKIRAALALLTSVASLSPGIVEELVRVFDFSLSSLPGIARPSRLKSSRKRDRAGAPRRSTSTRVAFLDWVLAMLRRADALRVQQLLGIPVICANLLAGLEDDVPDLQLRVLRTVRRRVMPTGVPPRLQAGVFNEAGMASLASLALAAEASATPAGTLAAEVLERLLVDPAHGVAIDPARAAKFTLASFEPLSAGMEGFIGQKRLLRWLATLRPTASSTHRRLLLGCAAADPRLAAELLASVTWSLEPAASADWLASAGLVTALQDHLRRSATLPLVAEPNPPIAALARRVVPGILPRALLSRGVQHPDRLVRFATLRMLRGALGALSALLASQAPGWAAAASLRRATAALLPDLQTVLSAVSKTGPARDDAAREAALRTLGAWVEALPGAWAEARVDLGRLVPADLAGLEAPHRAAVLELVDAALSSADNYYCGEGGPVNRRTAASLTPVGSGAGARMPPSGVLAPLLALLAVQGSVAPRALALRLLLPTGLFDAWPDEADVWLGCLASTGPDDAGARARAAFLNDCVVGALRRPDDLYAALASATPGDEAPAAPAFSLLALAVAQAAAKVQASVKIPAADREAVGAYAARALALVWDLAGLDGRQGAWLAAALSNALPATGMDPGTPLGRLAAALGAGGHAAPSPALLAELWVAAPSAGAPQNVSCVHAEALLLCAPGDAGPRLAALRATLAALAAAPRPLPDCGVLGAMRGALAVFSEDPHRGSTGAAWGAAARLALEAALGLGAESVGTLHATLGLLTSTAQGWLAAGAAPPFAGAVCLLAFDAAPQDAAPWQRAVLESSRGELAEALAARALHDALPLLAALARWPLPPGPRSAVVNALREARSLPGVAWDLLRQDESCGAAADRAVADSVWTVCGLGAVNGATEPTANAPGPFASALPPGALTPRLWERAVACLADEAARRLQALSGADVKGDDAIARAVQAAWAACRGPAAKLMPALACAAASALVRTAGLSLSAPHLLKALAAARTAEQLAPLLAPALEGMRGAASDPASSRRRVAELMCAALMGGQGARVAELGGQLGDLACVSLLPCLRLAMRLGGPAAEQAQALLDALAAQPGGLGAEVPAADKPAGTPPPRGLRLRMDMAAVVVGDPTLPCAVLTSALHLFTDALRRLFKAGKGCSPPEAALLACLDADISDAVAALPASQRSGQAFGELAEEVCRFGATLLKRRMGHEPTLRTLRRLAAGLLPDGGEGVPRGGCAAASRAADGLLQRLLFHPALLEILQTPGAAPLPAAAARIPQPLASIVPLVDVDDFGEETGGGENGDGAEPSTGAGADDHAAAGPSDGEARSTSHIGPPTPPATTAQGIKKEVCELLETLLDVAGQYGVGRYTPPGSLPALLPLLMGGYGATLSPADRALWSLAQSLNAVLAGGVDGGGSDQDNTRDAGDEDALALQRLLDGPLARQTGLAWGVAAVGAVAASEDHQLTRQILEQHLTIDPLRCGLSAVHFPEWRRLLGDSRPEESDTAAPTCDGWGAEAATAALRPGTKMYGPVCKEVLRAPVLDLRHVPLCRSVLLSGYPDAGEPRRWLLRLMRAGLRGPADARVLSSQHALERAMGLADAAALDARERDAALRLVCHAARPGASSVTIPDMTASLNAKVVVSDDQQADPAQLAACYDAMAANFLQHGLNIEAVQATRQYFDLSQGTVPRPLEYARFPSPLPEAAVRLGVLFMQKCNPTLASLAHQAALDIARHIPPGYLLHLNEPSHYHSTIVHCSLGRVLGGEGVDADAAARIAAACDAWTMRLAGAEWTAPGLTHVRETVFTTVEGPAVFMPFASEP
ncbi:hypothetical protein APUTEX25_001842 [Auxenochlorella protothecoides]|uniref:Uncharacterized protein n=1 Tax=Auxenochlorella protothecoides TaxID=3075 RepID=A0A3M7L7V2_AUXPR|nr:hypothetical protein APUTEX25_001842 [Auxenochlorella protothecoides]|eukprot:RMZ57642.1 hypothetical protein APUTEX25_001842 [Auxenochlorella protothecoides]